MRTRVILLGASNLTRSFPGVVAIARTLAGEPIDVAAAVGHGRSFGLRSRVLARSLPGIVDCGLWGALQAAPKAARTLALVTDVGNDIVYGAAVETICRWVDTCVSRLVALGAGTVLTQLPLESIGSTGPVRFGLAKTLLFPRHAITRRQVLDRAAAVARGLEETAGRHGAALQALPRSWYGLDPIHIRRARSREAWTAILAPWRPDAPSAQPAPIDRRAVRRARPEHWWLFGRPRSTPQPAARLADGTTISLY